MDNIQHNQTNNFLDLAANASFRVIEQDGKYSFVPRDEKEFQTDFYGWCRDNLRVIEDATLINLLAKYNHFDLKLNLTQTSQHHYSASLDEIFKDGKTHPISKKELMSRLKALEAKSHNDAAFQGKHNIPAELTELAARLSDNIIEDDFLYAIDLNYDTYMPLLDAIKESDGFKNHESFDYKQIASVLGFYYDKADANTRFALRALVDGFVERGDLAKVNGLEKFINPSPIAAPIAQKPSADEIAVFRQANQQRKLNHHNWIAKKGQEIARRKNAQGKLHISQHNPYEPDAIKGLFKKLSDPNNFRADDFLAHFGLVGASRDVLKKARGYIAEILNDLAQKGQIHPISPKRYSIEPAHPKFAQHLQLKLLDGQERNVIGLVDPFWDEHKKGPQPQIFIDNIPDKKLNKFLNNENVYIDATLTRHSNGSYMADIKNIYDIENGIDLARSQDFKHLLRSDGEKKEPSKTVQNWSNLAKRKARRQAKAAGIEAHKADQKARERKQREHSMQMNREAANRQKNETADANTSGASSAWSASKAGKGGSKGQKTDPVTPVSTGNARLDAILNEAPLKKSF